MFNRISYSEKDKLVLITVPYTYRDRSIAGNEGQYLMPGIAGGRSMVSMLSGLQPGQSANLVEFVGRVFTATPKPRRRYLALLHAHGTLTFQEDVQESWVAGYPYINRVDFLENPNHSLLQELHVPQESYTRTSHTGVGSVNWTEENLHYEYELLQYKVQRTALLAEGETIPLSRWIPRETPVMKEFFIPEYHQVYAKGFVFKGSLETWLLRFAIARFAGWDPEKPELLDVDRVTYGFRRAALDQTIYLALDLAGFFPVVGDFADGAGFAYASLTGNRDQMVNYGIATAIVGVTAVAVKAGKFIYAAGKTWFVKAGSQTAREVAQETLAKESLREILELGPAASDELLSAASLRITEGTLSPRGFISVAEGATEAERIARLRTVMAVEELIAENPQLSDGLNYLIIPDLATDPRHVDTWHLLATQYRYATDVHMVLYPAPFVLTNYLASHPVVMNKIITSTGKNYQALISVLDAFKLLDDGPAALLDDLAKSDVLLEAVVKDAVLVEGWRVTQPFTDLRTNVSDLQIVTDYIGRSSKTVDEVAGEIPSSLNDARKWLGDRKIEPFLEGNPQIVNISIPPNGYEFVSQLDGSKYIRRIDASDPYTPRLMVDETGTVVRYTKSQRLASNGLLRSRLESALGSIPENHQVHHLVPSKVVESSVLHQEAISRNLYDVDRVSNGKVLAETAEDFAPISEGLPTHFGSHPNYDVEINNVIGNVLNTPRSWAPGGVDIDGLPSLTSEQITELIDDVEFEALGVLEDWVPEKLN
ncbi:MAG: AHH domain-containing protein [Bacteroidota bacterium]